MTAWDWITVVLIVVLVPAVILLSRANRKYEDRRREELIKMVVRWTLEKERKRNETPTDHA